MSTRQSVWIGLFRGINIGGNRMPMKDLVKLLEAEGLSGVKTYIASGNVVFRSDRSADDLKTMIEDLVERNFGFRSRLFLIGLAHLEAVIAANPFREREHQGKAHHIFFLKDFVSFDDTRARGLKADSEDFALSDDAFYLYAPEGIGRSKLAEKLHHCLKSDMTARNLNTVEALQSMAAALAS